MDRYLRMVVTRRVVVTALVGIFIVYQVCGRIMVKKPNVHEAIQIAEENFNAENVKDFVAKEEDIDEQRRSYNQYCIPNVVHFVKMDDGLTPFTYQNFLAVYAAQKMFEPDLIVIHTREKPNDDWFNAVMNVGPAPVRINKEVDECYFDWTRNGKDIETPIHRSDFAKFCVLDMYGGIYLDLDAVAINPVPKELLCSGHDVIVGLEEEMDNGSIVTASVIMAKAGAPYLKYFRDKMEEVFDGQTTAHTIGLLTNTAGRDPRVLVLAAQTFSPAYDKKVFFAGKYAYPRLDSSDYFKFSGEYAGWDTSLVFHWFMSHPKIKSIQRRLVDPCTTLGIIHNAASSKRYMQYSVVPEGYSYVSPYKAKTKFDLKVMTPGQAVAGSTLCMALNDGTLDMNLVQSCQKEYDLVCVQPHKFFFPPV